MNIPGTAPGGTITITDMAAYIAWVEATYADGLDDE